MGGDPVARAGAEALQERLAAAAEHRTQQAGDGQDHVTVGEVDQDLNRAEVI